VAVADSAPVAPIDRLERELRRTVDRVRGLALTRLDAPFEPEPTRAGLAQRLVDAAADLEGLPRRPLPALAASACGDVLAVAGQDLLAAARSVQAASGADSDEARTGADVVDALADDLLGLRRRL
jgi:hypothetical protein